VAEDEVTPEFIVLVARVVLVAVGRAVVAAVVLLRVLRVVKPSFPDAVLRIVLPAVDVEACVGRVERTLTLPKVFCMLPEAEAWARVAPVVPAGVTERVMRLSATAAVLRDVCCGTAVRNCRALVALATPRASALAEKRVSGCAAAQSLRVRRALRSL
jgi:hypothetical protein